MDDLVSKIATALSEHNACLVYAVSACPNCLEDNIMVGRFVMLNHPWRQEGKDYDKIATLLCTNCSPPVIVNHEEVLRNLKSFMLKGILS